MPKCDLFLGNNIDVMDKLINEGVRVDLTVTSPPYDDMRDYENSVYWDFETFKKVANKLYDITKDGGVVVWVVGDKVVKGSESGTSFKQALYFKEIGFNLHDTMIYEKDSISFAEKTRYSQIFEYMFIFTKGKPNTVNLIKDRKNKCYNGKKHIKGSYRAKDGSQVQHHKKNLLQEYGTRYNIWRISTGHNKSTLDKFAFEHPAIFPEKLANDHILTWSNEGDLVLDCFMGSNTTGKMAKLLNRDFIGIEQVEKYYNIAKQRVDIV